MAPAQTSFIAALFEDVAPPTKTERLTMARSACDGVKFEWRALMRWQRFPSRMVENEDTGRLERKEDRSRIESGILLRDGDRPPRGAFPDLSDRRTLRILYGLAGMSLPGKGEAVDIDHLVDELRTTRLCPQPHLDAMDELKRRVVRARRGNPKATLAELADLLELRLVDVWNAQRWTSP